MADFGNLASLRSLRILTVAGLLLGLVSSADWWRESLELAEAEEVPAVILSSSLTSLTSGNEKSYRPEIRFKYLVDGLPRESVRVTPLDRSGSREWAEELMAKYRPGTTSSCYVPRDGDEPAYLVSETTWKAPIGSILGFGLALLCGYFWWRRQTSDSEVLPG